ncbi:MAG: hypothetical protein II936_02865 [Oscillospiraceae bacterium]|nr:hypothetical protein [Oscillospiraceae bacterium]
MSFLPTSIFNENFVLIAVGIILIFYAISNYRYSQRARDLKKRCTVPVDAVIVKVDMRRTDGFQNSVGRYQKNCTYLYEYNGNSYTVNNNVWSSIAEVREGQKVRLFIDPDCPYSEIFDPVAQAGLTNGYVSIAAGIIASILIIYIILFS